MQPISGRDPLSPKLGKFRGPATVLGAYKYKIIVVTSCGFVLCLGLSNAALAIDNYADDLDADKNTGRQDLTKKDEIAVAEVRESDADLLRLYIDKNPQSTATISQGERIEAKVNDQNYSAIDSFSQIKPLTYAGGPDTVLVYP